MTTLPRPLSGAEARPKFDSLTSPIEARLNAGLLHYLGFIVTHPEYGRGVVVLEENVQIVEHRRFLVAFPDSLQEVQPTQMKAHGFKKLLELVSLPVRYRKLPGHDQIEGWAYDISAAREALGGNR